MRSFHHNEVQLLRITRTISVTNPTMLWESLSTIKSLLKHLYKVFHAFLIAKTSASLESLTLVGPFNTRVLPKVFINTIGSCVPGFLLIALSMLNNILPFGRAKNDKSSFFACRSSLVYCHLPTKTSLRETFLL